MQGYLKQIQSFVTSPLCIFKLQPIDYPSKFQQQFIESYFNFIKILQKPHNQIIRQFNSQSPFMIASGFIYLLLLDEKNRQRLQQYLMILRAETWSAMSQQFQRLLFQNSDSIKQCYRVNLVHIFNLLFLYGMTNLPIIRHLANLIKYYENVKTGAQKYTRSLLQSLKQKLKQNNGFFRQQDFFVYRFILAKLIKITPFYDQQLCGSIIDLIWSQYAQKYQNIHQQFLYIIQSSNIYMKIPSITTIYRTIKQNQANLSYDGILSAQLSFQLLPSSIQKLLQFSFMHKLSHYELKYQLTWLQKSWHINNINNIEAIIDISRLITLGDDYLEQRIVILQWACRKGLSSSPQNFNRLKRAIYYNWFINKLNFQLIITSIILLKHFLTNDTRLSIQVLNYLFKLRTSPKIELRLSQIFQQANKLGYIKMQKITRNNLIPLNIQQTYLSLLQSPQLDLTTALKFNPESPNKSSQGQAPNYEPSVQNTPQAQSQRNKNSLITQNIIDNMEVNLKNESYERQRQELFLEEEFVNQFDMQLLENMLNNPSFQTFVVFLKTFTKIGGQARQNNKQLIVTLVQEAAKIIYCAFNNEFQDITNIIQPQKSVIYYILSILLKEWHQLTHRIQLIKSLVKKLCELFPTAEVAFWYYFIMQFEYGGANNRDFKNWIIPKQKLGFVLTAVQALTGKSDQNFIKKALKYSIK